MGLSRTTFGTDDSVTVMRLLTDVAALGGEANRQAQCLLGSLQRLIETPVAWVVIVEDHLSGKTPRVAYRAVADGLNEASLRCLEEFVAGPSFSADPIINVHDGDGSVRCS